MALTVTYTAPNITVTGVGVFSDIQTANDIGGWGVCTTIGNCIKIDANLIIGDSVTATNLTDSNITYQNGSIAGFFQWSVMANAVFSLDSFMLIDFSTNNYGNINGTLSFTNGSWIGNASENNCWIYNTYTLKNMVIENITFVQQATGVVDRVTIKNVGLYVFTQTTSFSDIVSSSAIYVDAGLNPVITNSLFTGLELISFWLPATTDFCDVTLIDCTATNWVFSITASNKGGYTIRRKQSFATVISNAGLPVQNCNVALIDKNNAIEFNLSTDVNGTYPQQNVTQGIYTRASPSIVYNTPHTYKVRKYGMVYQDFLKNITDKTREGSPVLVNPVITQTTESIVAGYTGIAIDGVAKTITITGISITKEMLYDYCQHWAGLTANMIYDEPLQSAGGINFTLSTSWVLVLNKQISGGINLTGNITLNAIIDLTSHNISGNLTFTVIGTYLLTNCSVLNVANTSAGTVLINALGTTNITNNTGPNITINNTKVFTVIGLIAGSIVEIYDNEIVNIGNNDTLLASTQNSGTSFAYTHNGVTNAIRVQVLKTGYIEEIHDFSLSNVDQSLSIKQRADLND